MRPVVRECASGPVPQRFQGFREVFWGSSFSCCVPEQEWDFTGSIGSKDRVAARLQLVAVTFSRVRCRDLT